MKNRIKELFKTLPKDVIFNQDEVFEFFKNHHKFNQKVVGFIIKKNEWGYSFHLVEEGNKFTPVSMNFNVKDSKKTETLKALRNEVQHEVNKVRNSIVYGVDRCGLTNELLVKGNVHIDHFDLEFRYLADFFMNKYKDLEYKKIGVKFFLTDSKIKDEWVKYHNENTNLRAVTAKANLTRKKK